MKAEELPSISFLGWLRDNMPSEYCKLVNMACAVAMAEIKPVSKTDKVLGQKQVLEERTALRDYLRGVKIRSASKGVTLKGPLSVYEIVNFAG
jgi:hypothetical protein